MTRLEYLTRLIAALRRPEHGDLEIEFKPFTGWILFGEARSFGDDGQDFAGRNWREAETWLRWYLA
jgi:hypothetical protein